MTGLNIVKNIKKEQKGTSHQMALLNLRWQHIRMELLQQAMKPKKELALANS